MFLEQLTDAQLVKKFPLSYGTRMFIVVFTRLCAASLLCLHVDSKDGDSCPETSVKLLPDLTSQKKRPSQSHSLKYHKKNVRFIVCKWRRDSGVSGLAKMASFCEYGNGPQASKTVRNSLANCASVNSSTKILYLRDKRKFEAIPKRHAVNKYGSSTDS
jgi:hypothetical protein